MGIAVRKTSQTRTVVGTVKTVAFMDGAMALIPGSSRRRKSDTATALVWQ